MDSEAKMTIADVCRYAKISRSTFYRRYQAAMDAHPDAEETAGSGRPRYSLRQTRQIILRPRRQRAKTRKKSTRPVQPGLPGMAA
ncbi:MAG: hypothetical protein EPO32_01540 [Anaerolineae bacterium]|nr:MAG: hypothetical protein EPO32_01540 [Anaerolineae bacterium]